MFQRASTQRSRIQPIQTTKPSITDENNNNNNNNIMMNPRKPAVAGAIDPVGLKGKQVGLAASKSFSTTGSTATTTIMTRKRRALGDVSNQQPAATTNGAEAAPATKALKPLTKPTSRIAQAVSKKPAATVVAVEPQLASTTNILTRAARRKSLQLAEGPAAAKPMLRQSVAVNESKLQSVELEQDENKRPKTSAVVNTKQWDDLDADDAGDPVMVSEYVVEIFEYLRKLELKTMPDPNYMSKQKELQWKMRGILIDWLVDVHGRFRLLPETLFLTINLIDRFLSIRNVSITKLQLVGITAMFIAAKYEEVYAPSINQFVYIADGGYSNEELIKAERYMLAMLDFNLQYPNPLNFLRRCSKADGYDLETRNYSKYLMEVAMLDEQLLSFPPSMIAASSMYLSRYVLNRGKWDNNLQHYSGYTVDEMKDCVRLLLKSLAGERKLHAVFNKYNNSRFQNAGGYFGIFVSTYQHREDFGMIWE